jgi:hypothetical protein
MVALFRTNQSFVNLLLFGYALILQLPVFLLDYPVAEPSVASYYGRALTEWVGRSPLLSTLLPPLLAATAGVVANWIARRHRLSRSVTQLPGMALVVLWALSPAFRTFHPHQLNFVLILLLLASLARTYQRKSEEVSRFNAGLWLAAASLLVPSCLLLFPLAIVGIGIYRTANLRSIFQLVGGMGVVYFLAGANAFWWGEWESFWYGLVAGFGGGRFVAGTPFVTIGTALLVLPLLTVLFGSRRSRALLSIEGAKNVLFFFWLLLFTLSVALLTPLTTLGDAQVVVPPLGLLWGLWLSRLPVAQAEFVHLLCFTAATVLAVLHGMNTAY